MRNRHDDELIQKIMDLNYGIFGRERCTRCGQMKNFHGWPSAMGSHQMGKFICFDCPKSAPEQPAQPVKESDRLENDKSETRPDSRRTYLEWYAEQEDKSLVQLFENLLLATLEMKIVRRE